MRCGFQWPARRLRPESIRTRPGRLNRGALEVIVPLAALAGQTNLADDVKAPPAISSRHLRIDAVRVVSHFEPVDQPEHLADPWRDLGRDRPARWMLAGCSATSRPHASPCVADAAPSLGAHLDLDHENDPVRSTWRERSLGQATEPTPGLCRRDGRVRSACCNCEEPRDLPRDLDYAPGADRGAEPREAEPACPPGSLRT